MTRTRASHIKSTSTNSRPTQGIYWFIVLLIAAVFVVAMNRAASAVHSEYNSIDTQIASNSNDVAAANIGNSTLHIRTWENFTKGNIWSLVSKAHALPESFTPKLISAPVAHTSGDLQVAERIGPYLTALFKAAAKDDIDLMLSSAYRSASDQQQVYTSYLNMYGQSYVNSYVALPGTSEHQTGLAVDIATKSTECQHGANNCSLDYASIVWLNQNAEKFGFIQRYPSGKQSITGISGEAWHYRFVGVQLAQLLSDNNMTLDEFVQQVAPGYSKNLE